MHCHETRGGATLQVSVCTPQAAQVLLQVQMKNRHSWLSSGAQSVSAIGAGVKPLMGRGVEHRGKAASRCGSRSAVDAIELARVAGAAEGRWRLIPGPPPMR